MPIAAEMNPFQSKVSGDQGLVTGRKPKYSAIVSDTRQHAISCARLPANPGDQSFFKKRQSEANIDDKTIPPKPDWLSVFLGGTLTSSRFIYPCRTPSPAYTPQLRHPRLGLADRRSFRRSPAVTVPRDYARLPVLGN